jgi:hypothetical protein
MEKRFEFPKGELAFEAVGRSVLAFRFRGHLEEAAARKIIELRTAALDTSTSVEEFHDWWGMTSYDSVSRTLLTDDSLERRKLIDHIHLLVLSKLVRMGVSVASIVLGDQIVSYGERRTFERALRDAATR